jgi:hypothetical protein
LPIPSGLPRMQCPFFAQHILITVCHFLLAILSGGVAVCSASRVRHSATPCPSFLRARPIISPPPSVSPGCRDHWEIISFWPWGNINIRPECAIRAVPNLRNLAKCPDSWR